MSYFLVAVNLISSNFRKKRVYFGKWFSGDTFYYGGGSKADSSSHHSQGQEAEDEQDVDSAYKTSRPPPVAHFLKVSQPSQTSPAGDEVLNHMCGRGHFIFKPLHQGCE